MTDNPLETPDPDRIVSVNDGPEVEEVVKGSRFIGQALRATDEETALDRLDVVRATYPDASHHCWAYRIGDPDHARTRADDDGEPGRTAGAPILVSIEGANVSDLMVIVTRYFGGTKLGKGGLVRAYGSAARAALAAAPRGESFRRDVFTVRVGYEDLGAIEACIARHADTIFETRREFEIAPMLIVDVRRSVAAALMQEMVDATGGRARLTLTDRDSP